MKRLKLVSIVAAIGLFGVVGSADAGTSFTKYKLLDEGVYTIQDGVISGELPPGETLDDISIDPSDPGQADRVAQAEPGALRLADGRPNGPVVGSGDPPTATMGESYNEGCVTLFVSAIPGTGLGYTANMVGCRRGELYLHAYVRHGSTGAIIDNGYDNVCYLSTSCTVPNDVYTGGAATIKFVAHGVNRTTGGDSTAWALYGRTW